jgi:hypothetical protein
MGILVPKACWASNKICNKYLCCILLAFYFHILTTMYGQNHIKYVWNVVNYQHVSIAFFVFIINVAFQE